MEKRNIYQRILGVMKDVTYIQKSEKRVDNQYRFVSHDQVSAVIHPALVNHGIVAVPTVKSLTQEEFMSSVKAPNGSFYDKKQQRTSVCLNVKFVNVDDPNDFIDIDAWGYGLDYSDKGPGKAVSYAFKYAILKIFCLETGDDPDQNQEMTLNESQQKEIQTVVGNDDALAERVLKGYERKYRKPVRSFADIKQEDFGPAISKLKETPRPIARNV